MMMDDDDDDEGNNDDDRNDYKNDCDRNDHVQAKRQSMMPIDGAALAAFRNTRVERRANE